MILQPIIICLSSTVSQLELSCSGSYPKVMAEERLAHPVPKVPLASSAQLSCPQPIQLSLCLVPSLGSSVTALELLGSRGRNVGMCSKYRASTNHWGIRAGQGSQCQLPGTAGTEEPGLHLAWHMHAGWMTTGFPKVFHLPESITLFQSPNSNSLSNLPISQTYSGGRTLGFHSLETPESFLFSSPMNSQVC